MILRATHRTLYRYRSPSTDSHNEVRLEPLTDEFQRCREFTLTTRPATKAGSYAEPGGVVHFFGLSGAHTTLEILGRSVVDTFLVDPYKGVNLLEDDWGFYAEETTRHRYAEFLTETPYVSLLPEISAMAESVRQFGAKSVATFLLALNTHLHETLTYDPDATHVHSTLDEVVSLRAGVCQDFAHLMIACCRAVGLPARYVSGYLYCDGCSTMRGDQATHAWVEVPMESGRWLSLDPTNNLLANDRYVRVHTGRDYGDVTPTRGVYMGHPAESLEVSVQVDRLEALATA